MVVAAFKQRDVQTAGIAADTFILRSRSWARLKFEIEYALQKGTTANSYLLQGDKTALIDPPGGSFVEIFLEALEQRIDLQQLDYLILGHTNPNRAKTLARILKRAPHVKIYCSSPAAQSLPNLLQKEGLETLPDLQVIRKQSRLDLGKDHCLQFLSTPTPRWPDGVCTYDPATRLLFSNKFFCAHVCGDQIADEGWPVYAIDRQYYYDSLMATQARQVDAVLDRFEPLDISLYAPAHGPLVRYGLVSLTENYRNWNRKQASQTLSAAVLYASAYGNTAAMAQAIARGISKAGVTVESINCEFVQPAEIQAILEKTAGFAIGSPTIGGHVPTPVQTALGVALSTASKTQLVGAFGSYGWSGEAVEAIASKLRDAGYTFGFEPLAIKFAPTAAILQQFEQLGTDFAQALKKERKVKARPQPATGVERAVGRIIGSLCVVTARQDDISSAMLADWIAQATFNPPGLTIAVAKDRAIESLLYPGNPFALNILADGRHIPLMKHFLKPFGPGEDRFDGVSTRVADNGAPILDDALAYLECRVEQRLDCNDHWLVYAIVEAGNVLDSKGKTAIHHRSTGTRY
ncbi:MAG: diflavin flavoprotein [Cyanobacteria bacterium J06642_2]